MKKTRWACVAALCASAGLEPAAARAEPPTRPFPQHVVYAPGHALPAHRTQAELDEDVRGLYDAWKSRYLAAAGQEPDGHPRYRVRSGRDPDAPTFSEGQGYGLMITALLAGHDPAARPIFDGLLEFTLDHPSTIDARLADWLVAADEMPEPEGNDSAFDADADIAYALLMAAQQWPEPGRLDYAALAASRLDGLLASAVGPTTRLPLLGDWVDPGGETWSEHTPRLSDVLPDHFAAFAAAGDALAWLEVRAASTWLLGFVQDTYGGATGLVPDFVVPTSETDPTPRPADPHFLEGPFDGDYYYNSLRVPLRLGIAGLVGNDADSADRARRIAAFALADTGGDPAALRAGYALDGTPLPGSGYFTTAFAAPIGVAAMWLPGSPGWLEALYDRARVSDESYYEDTLSLIALIVMSGNYWSPAGAPPAVPVTTPFGATLLALLIAAAPAWRQALRRRRG